MIVVFVGTNRMSFFVYKDVICTSSTWFERFFKKDSPTVDYKMIDLPKHHPTTFKIYLEWMYSQKKDLASLYRTSIQPTEDDDLKTKTFHALLSLWYLADALEDTAFKNDVVTSFIVEHNANGIQIDPARITEVFARTLAGSGLRKWLIEATIPLMTASWLDAYKDILPQELVFQALKNLAVKSGEAVHSIPPKRVEAWRYYEHAQKV